MAASFPAFAWRGFRADAAIQTCRDFREKSILNRTFIRFKITKRCSLLRKGRGGYNSEARIARRCCEVRCRLHFERHRSRCAYGLPWKRDGGGHMPQLFGRRALHHAFKGAVHQRVRLRLRLLREPLLQRRSARFVPAARIGRSHHGVLPAQLHRGPVSFERGFEKPRLHDGAHYRMPAHPSRGIRLSRLHSCEGGSGNVV